MASLEPVSFRPPPGVPAQRELFGRLARALAVRSPPAAVVIEWELGNPLPRVTARPASLVRSAMPGSSPERGHGPLGPPSVPGNECEYGALEVSPPAAPPPSATGSRPGPPAPVPPSGGWFGVQVLWGPEGAGQLRVATRFQVAAPSPTALRHVADEVGGWLAESWVRATGRVARARPKGRGAARAWTRASLGRHPDWEWSRADVASAALAAFVPPCSPRLDGPPPAHALVFGASGSGKTVYLARLAADEVAAGRPVVVLDLHGDLAPRILGLLPEGVRPTVVAVDVSDRPVPGLAGLVRQGSVDRAAGHFVAAVKRLSPDGVELAWGFRLERIFDSFARVVLESEGTLLDLYDLLTSPERREAARLTARPGVDRFLDELATIVRRDPEFLWSAATRLSKIVLVPGLRDLLAPRDGGLLAERLLRVGRSLFVRLPQAAIGPEAATFAATLLLGRLYLGLASEPPGEDAASVLLVLDEAQAFPARLVSELLSESRKFGLRVILATQHPARFAPDLRAAASASTARCVVLRTPPGGAADVSDWLGIAPAAAVELLPGLAVGDGVVWDADAGGPHRLNAPLAPPPLTFGAWREAVIATRVEFGVTGEDEASGSGDLARDRIRLALFSATAGARSLTTDEVVPAASALPGPPVPPDELEAAWRELRGGPEVDAAAGVRLTPLGSRRLGWGTPTGARRESSEHRALLLRAFLLLARRGYLLEIVRQGRFDTTLPDGLLRVLPPAARNAPPVRLASALAHATQGWLWRAFGGRDVFFEAEVSGALRAERIRHGCRKAERAGTAVVFLVHHPAAARRVGRVLRELGLGPARAQVWTLPAGWGNLGSPLAESPGRNAGAAPGGESS